MSWLDLVKQLAPIIIAAKVPHGDVIAPYVVTGIESAEALKNSKTGEEKLQHSIEITNTFVDGYNSVAPNKLDKNAINATLGSGISTAVMIANLLHKGK